MLRKKSLAGTAIVAIAGMALVGCAAAAPEDTETAVATDTINLEVWYAPATFNPALASATSDVQNARLGFDTLLRVGEDGVIGGLATDWETVSSTEYVFTLRDDATCSDGTAITPTVVAN